MLSDHVYSKFTNQYDAKVKEDNERVCKLITAAQKKVQDEIDKQKNNLEAVDRCIDLLPGDPYADNSRVYVMAHVNYRNIRDKEREFEELSKPSLTESEFNKITGDDLPF